MKRKCKMQNRGSGGTGRRERVARLISRLILSHFVTLDHQCPSQEHTLARHSSCILAGPQFNLLVVRNGELRRTKAVFGPFGSQPAIGRNTIGDA